MPVTRSHAKAQKQQKSVRYTQSPTAPTQRPNATPLDAPGSQVTTPSSAEDEDYFLRNILDPQLLAESLAQLILGKVSAKSQTLITLKKHLQLPSGSKSEPLSPCHTTIPHLPPPQSTTSHILNPNIQHRTPTTTTSTMPLAQCGTLQEGYNFSFPTLPIGTIEPTFGPGDTEGYYPTYYPSFANSHTPPPPETSFRPDQEFNYHRSFPASPLMSPPIAATPAHRGGMPPLQGGINSSGEWIPRATIEVLYIPSSGRQAKRRARRNKEKMLQGENVKIPRPLNQFMLFRKAYEAQVDRNALPTTVSRMSTHIGKLWRGLSPEERAEWDVLQGLEKERHRRLYPNYVYRPEQKYKAERKTCH